MLGLRPLRPRQGGQQHAACVLWRHPSKLRSRPVDQHRPQLADLAVYPVELGQRIPPETHHSRLVAALFRNEAASRCSIPHRGIITTSGDAYASRDDVITKRRGSRSVERPASECSSALPGLSASSAQTVVSPASGEEHTPQRRASRSTMPRPRPPIAEWPGSFTTGAVGPPPSLTAISRQSSSSHQATRTTQPCSGVACRRALLISSLRTRPASHAVASNTPASERSPIRRRRATPTLEAVYGSISTLDVPTSMRIPPRP